jgi:sulfur dioxygenase
MYFRFSCIKDIQLATLHAVEAEYDPKSPQFGAGPRPRHSGLWIEWALEHTGICKGDR